MSRAAIGVIGGSGLYEIEGLTNVREERIETPFGEPSDAYVTGDLGGRRLVFLPRHGRGHRLMPSEVNYRANVYGFRALGARWLLSLSAVGSMREEIRPGDLVVVDQLFDRTKGVRESTFFGGGVVGHVPFGEPICPDLAGVLAEAAAESGARVHRGGTYICIEGPAFSTRAESNIYRRWGVDVIGMTAIPEAKLAREAGLCYAVLAMCTDYDCWHEEEEDVSVEGVLEVLRKNAARAKRIVAGVAARLGPERACRHAGSAASALITAPEARDPDALRRLALLLDGDEASS